MTSSSRPCPISPVIADPDSGMFCRPGCSVLPETECRLTSHPSAKAALEWGFRPCADCRPTDPEPGDLPVADEKARRITELMDDVAADAGYRVRTGGLLERGIDPDGLRKIFQKRFGMSFQDYLRMRRVNLRFGPSEASRGKPKPDDLLFARLATPLGPMLSAATEDGVCLLEFSERRMMETQIARLERYHDGDMVMGRRGLHQRLEDELDAYFRGILRTFTVPLDLRGTDFQKAVWAELMRIPYGSVRSYGEQARALGNPGAVRAVARANGDNPVGILVPCHRVVGADGSMTGYGGRIWRKEALLRLESSQEELF